MNITVFDRSTGQILRTASVPLGSASYQVRPDVEDWIEGEYRDDLYYMDGYTPVPRPPRPSPHHEFDFTTKTWNDPRTLADLKATKREAINVAWDVADTDHFLFQGQRISADPQSIARIQGTNGAVLLVQGLPPGWPGGWKTQDNGWIPISDVQTWAAFYGAMLVQGSANFAHAQSLKARVDAAKTPEELAAIPAW